MADKSQKRKESKGKPKKEKKTDLIPHHPAWQTTLRPTKNTKTSRTTAKEPMNERPAADLGYALRHRTAFGC